MGACFRFRETSPIAVMVVPMVMPVVVMVPRTMADPVRPVIRPDHPAIAVRITVIGWIIGRSVEVPEVVPVVEVRPVVGVAIAAIVKRAITTAIKTTAMEASAMEATASAVEATSSTMEATASTVEASAVEAATSAVEPAAATATVTTTAAVTAANLDHRSVGCDFR